MQLSVLFRVRFLRVSIYLTFEYLMKVSAGKHQVYYMIYLRLHYTNLCSQLQYKTKAVRLISAVAELDLIQLVSDKACQCHDYERLLTLPEHLGIPPVVCLFVCFLSFCFVCLFFCLFVFVLFFFMDLCCSSFQSCFDLIVVFCVFVLCLVCPMLPVSLDCPFLIAPAVFSNVYHGRSLVFYTHISIKLIATLSMKYGSNWS